MIKLMAFVTRLPHVDRDAFKAHYETTHAPLILSLMPSIHSYERNYPDATKVRPLDGWTIDETIGFDAVAILKFSDREGLESFKQAMRDPDIARLIAEDEANFLDSAKSRLYVVDEQVSAKQA